MDKIYQLAGQAFPFQILPWKRKLNGRIIILLFQEKSRIFGKDNVLLVSTYHHFRLCEKLFQCYFVDFLIELSTIKDNAALLLLSAFHLAVRNSNTERLTIWACLQTSLTLHTGRVSQASK